MNDYILITTLSNFCICTHVHVCFHLWSSTLSHGLLLVLGLWPVDACWRYLNFILDSVKFSLLFCNQYNVIQLSRG